MSEVRIGDLWLYRGERDRKALPQVSVVELRQGGGRALLLYTFPAGRMREQRRWCSFERLHRNYRLVGRQEVLA